MNGILRKINIATIYLTHAIVMYFLIRVILYLRKNKIDKMLLLRIIIIFSLYFISLILMDYYNIFSAV